MSCVIDLAGRRHNSSSVQSLSHPSGITLPFEGPENADLLIPEIRNAICSGTYSADMISHLPEAVKPGDRVLVIGAGLGVVSSLIAKMLGVERVIAIEADPAVIPYLNRVHALNDVKSVETVNAVLTDNRTCRVPFFSRHDVRTSSLLPEDGEWEQVMRVPCMDLNLILAEENITLIVCEIPTATAQLLECAELGLVERILVNSGDAQKASQEASEVSEVSKLLAERGFTAESHRAARLFGRPDEEIEAYEELTERSA